MNWFHKWRLRRAREKYAAWKARREAMDRQYPITASEDYQEAVGKEAKYLERVEDFMRR